MAAFNTNFELDVNDLERIEAALRSHKKTLSLERVNLIGDDIPAPDTDRIEDINAEVTEIQDLLGRLHNQKVFYRPGKAKKAPYIGG